MRSRRPAVGGSAGGVLHLVGDTLRTERLRDWHGRTDISTQKPCPCDRKCAPSLCIGRTATDSPTNEQTVDNSPDVSQPNRIYHLALREHWEQALADGSYRESTLGRSLEEEGFIHCSFAEQVQRIKDLFYGGRADVVLLEIDPALVPAEIRIEQVGDNRFPHIYGELTVDAVVHVSDAPADSES
jgi:uncharacterized protein (DUF952 family)